MTNDYRERVIDALTSTCRLHELFEGECRRCDQRLAAVMAVRDAELEQVRAECVDLRDAVGRDIAIIVRLRAALDVVTTALVHDPDASACRQREAHQEALSPCQRKTAEYDGPCPACAALDLLPAIIGEGS